MKLPTRVRHHTRRRALSFLLGIMLFLITIVWAVPAHGAAYRGGNTAPTAPRLSISGLHVQGNQLVNGSGQAIRLLGVDRSGTEYACIQG